MPGEDAHRFILDAALHGVPEVRGLGSGFLEGLYRGVVEPDKVVDEVEVCSDGMERKACKREPIKDYTDSEYLKELIDYYYVLSIYYYRRGDPHLSGIALGRALHYVHDNTLVYTGVGERGVQEERIREIIGRGVDIGSLCRDADIELGTKSSNLVEPLCAMYKSSIDMLRQFTREISKTLTSEEIERLKKYRERVARLSPLWVLAFLTVGLMVLASFFILIPFYGALGAVPLIAFIVIIIAFKLHKVKESIVMRELAKAGIEKPQTRTKVIEKGSVRILPAY
jgi:hypothetical protein